MCDEDLRCRTQHHRPGTICPYSKRGSRGSGYVPSEPIKFNGPVVKKSTTAPASRPVRHDDWRPWKSSGVCIAVLLAMCFFATTRTGGIVNLPLVLVGGLLVVIPAGIASSLMYRCHAWLNNETRRCQKPRKGFMMRCRHHQGQIVVAYDVAALVAGAVAMVNSWLAFQILRHANEFDLTPITLVAR